MKTLENDLAGYTPGETAALKGLFDMFDTEKIGTVRSADLEDILEKVGRDPAEAKDMLKNSDPDRTGTIDFEEFLKLLATTKTPMEYTGPDPKVMEFLRILEEYRKKCEEEGNYLEAGRAANQADTLRRQEEKRQAKALKARQISERQDVQIAHNMQYSEFNAAWDKYMDEYDQMAQMYIQQMTEKHSIKLREFQEKLQKDVMKRPPKFSKELLDWRSREQMLARQRKYAEAQKIKRIADKLENKERRSLDGQNKSVFERKESEFRKQHKSELAALLKRIDGRRKEHIKQRNLDSKRLLQRNRNVQAVLESKQTTQAKKILDEVKEALAPSRRRQETRSVIDSGVSVNKLRRMRLKKKADNASKNNNQVASTAAKTNESTTFLTETKEGGI